VLLLLLFYFYYVYFCYLLLLWNIHQLPLKSPQIQKPLREMASPNCRVSRLRVDMESEVDGWILGLNWCNLIPCPLAMSTCWKCFSFDDIWWISPASRARAGTTTVPPAHRVLDLAQAETSTSSGAQMAFYVLFQRDCVLSRFCYVPLIHP
jgi:hypothetical protein